MALDSMMEDINVRLETISLDELHADARREGDTLVIYAGGDNANPSGLPLVR